MYDLEDMLDSKVEHRVVKYMVRWKGYDPDDFHNDTLRNLECQDASCEGSLGWGRSIYGFLANPPQGRIQQWQRGAVIMRVVIPATSKPGEQKDNVYDRQSITSKEDPA